MHAAGEDSTSPPRPGRDRSAFLLVITGTFGLQALTLVTGVITARLLGVEGRGQVALVFALGLMGSQLTLGSSLPNAIAKGLAERGVAARDGLRSIARRRAAWLVVPCVGSAGVMLFLQRDAATDVMYGLALAVFLMTLQTISFRLLTGSLQGEVGHLGRMAVVGMVPQFLFAMELAVVWTVGWDWGVFDVFLGYFIACAVGMVIGYFSLAKPTLRRADVLDERELWRTTRHTYVSSVRPLDSIGLDRILVGGLLGSAPLGLYAAATAVSNLCSTVGNAVSVIVLPRVAMTNHDPAAQRAVVRRWLSFSAVLIVCTVAALEVVVSPAIRLAFGEEFTGAIETARWLILADGLLGFRKVLIAVLQGQGRGSTASWIELILTPAMVLGIVLASLDDQLVGIGITMVSMGVLAMATLGVAVLRGTPAAQPVSPPSTTRT